MNRRDALKAATAALAGAGLADTVRAEAIEADDSRPILALVLKADGPITGRMAASMRSCMKNALASSALAAVPVLVLDGSMTLEVIRGPATEKAIEVKVKHEQA